MYHNSSMGQRTTALWACGTSPLYPSDSCPIGLWHISTIPSHNTEVCHTFNMVGSATCPVAITRLDFLTSKSTEEVGQFVATVIDNNFATELITELAKAFLRAEDRNTQVRITGVVVYVKHSSR